MNKRQFIQLSAQAAIGVALLPALLTSKEAIAQNKTRFDKRRLFRGFRNNDDDIFQGFAYHAFNNGRAPRIQLPDGTYTYFIDSFVGNVSPPSTRIKQATPTLEPGYWLVAVKLDEIYNTGVNIERFRKKRLDVFQYAVDTHANGDLVESRSLSPEMRAFILGIKAFMDKYSSTSRHGDRQRISDEDIERHFMTSIYYAAYRDKGQPEENIDQAVDNFMSTAVSQRRTLAEAVFKALEETGRGDSETTDPNNAYSRQYVAIWSSYIIGTKIALFEGDIEKSQLLKTQIESPLEQLVPAIRPDINRGEPVLKI